MCVYNVFSLHFEQVNKVYLKTIMAEQGLFEDSTMSEQGQKDVVIGIDLGTSVCRVAVWNCSKVELLSNSQEQILMKPFVSFKDQNHPKRGVTSPLANDCELFSGSIIYKIKCLLCIPVPDTTLKFFRANIFFWCSQQNLVPCN